jgi:hypothetical protein
MIFKQGYIKLAESISRGGPRAITRELYDSLGGNICLCGIDFAPQRNPIQVNNTQNAQNGYMFLFSIYVILTKIDFHLKGLAILGSRKSAQQKYGSSLLQRMYIASGKLVRTETGNPSIWGVPRFPNLAHLGPVQAAAAMFESFISIPGPRCIKIKIDGTPQLALRRLPSYGGNKGGEGRKTKRAATGGEPSNKRV